MYVARVDNGATRAQATTYDANNAVVAAGSFEGLYPGVLGNSLEVAYVDGASYEGTIVTLGNIPTNKITGNTDITHTLAFNTDTITFEVAKANKIAVATVAADDVFVIGNTSVGFKAFLLLQLLKKQETLPVLLRLMIH